MQGRGGGRRETGRWAGTAGRGRLTSGTATPAQAAGPQGSSTAHSAAHPGCLPCLKFRSEKPTEMEPPLASLTVTWRLGTRGGQARQANGTWELADKSDSQLRWELPLASCHDLAVGRRAVGMAGASTDGSTRCFPSNTARGAGTGVVLSRHPAGWAPKHSRRRVARCRVEHAAAAQCNSPDNKQHSRVGR